MSLSGYVQNGVVVLDGGAYLPEGTRVQVEPVIADTEAADARQASWDTAFQAACELENYDFDAWKRLRDYDLEHVRDRLS